MEQIFQSALEREPADRPAFLDAACENDPALRRELDSLLSCATGAQDLVQSAVCREAETLQRTAAPLEGSRIGLYQVVRELGRGGMGEVYLATRADGEYQKHAAIKVVKRGMDTDLLLGRFRQERQILARLEHPNIARLLDGGATADGRPYFVMEYVDGVPITTYCEQRQLPAGERLQLFRHVCAAVQYAHQNLVVHRDLKPGNILVTAAGEPKLLDFGVAKLLRPETEDGDASATVTVLQAMTPQYASPEQVEGAPIATATDIYALGAILYELLSGRKAHAFQALTPEEIRRVICTTAPGRLDGDLDNIVRMAMRKEPQRRYPSADQFSEDLRRYLEGRPVVARPDTLRYRTAKFIRRNKLGVAAGAAILLLGAGFTATTSVQAARIRRERDKAQQVTRFLVESFRVADPGESRGNAVTVREILDRSVDNVSRNLGGQPDVQASLFDVMGKVHLSLGLYNKAVSILQRSVDIRRRALGAESAELAFSLSDLGDALRSNGQYDAAGTQLRAALAMQRKLLGHDHKDIAGTLNNLGVLSYDRREFTAGEALLRESLEMYAHLPGDNRFEATNARTNLAELLMEKGDYASAEPLLRQTLATFRELLGNDHPLVANALNSLGVLFDHKGDVPASERSYREALALRRKILGPRHPDVATTLSSLGLLLSTYGRTAEAQPLYQEALSIHIETVGADRQDVAVDRNNLALLLMKRGDLDGAEREFRESLRIFLLAHGRENADTARCMNNLAGVLHEKGKLREAETLYRQALLIRRKTLPPANYEIGTSLTNLGRLLTDRGLASQAEPLLRESAGLQRKALPAGHWRIADAESALGGCLTALRRFQEAEPLLVPSYEALLASRGAQDIRTRLALERLRRLYQLWGKPDKESRYR
ncbi:MAG: serine/threonine protein kinase [Candidatus Solibacter usitatus]|nr:serine/threonine protein kinase [Candidatus Solibacter usitatus]